MTLQGTGDADGTREIAEGEALTGAGPGRRRSATRRVFLRLCGAALGAGLAGPLEAHYLEPALIEVTRHDVFLPHLPPELDGLRVAHLTDMHRGRVTPDTVIRRAVELAAAEKPDMVVLTGDFVDYDPVDAAPLASMLGALRPRLGMWGCLGNHDYVQDPATVAKALERGAGVRMLRNAGAEPAPGLWVAGIEDTYAGTPDVPAARAAIPPKSAAALFLTHNPTGVFSVIEEPWLVLAGHTHGGQVRLPGLPPHLPPGMIGFPQFEGWGHYERAWLYISRGIGMVGLPVRFRCRPEVVILTLRPGDAMPVSHTRTLAQRAASKAGRIARRTLRASAG